MKKKQHKPRPKPNPTLRHRIAARIIPDWKSVARKAWSVRLMVGAFALLAGGAAALPFLAPAIPVKWLAGYVGVIFLCVSGAIVARFVAQKELGVDLDAD